MSESHIQAESRTEFGKGAARRIRRADKVPAVLYGHGTDPVHITLPGHGTMLALKHGGLNALLTISVDGKDHLALPKQIHSSTADPALVQPDPGTPELRDLSVRQVKSSVRRAICPGGG